MNDAGRRMAVLAVVAAAAAAAAGCTSMQDGAVLRFGPRTWGTDVAHEVPFEDGRMLGIGFGRTASWADGADAWEGRKAKGVAPTAVGDRVTVRTVWEAVEGEVVRLENGHCILRLEQPLYARSEGAGAWTGDGRVIGVVTGRRSADFTHVQIFLPGGVKEAVRTPTLAAAPSAPSAPADVASTGR
ncbi:MAG: hypothetical protein L6R43_02715 [Planctomycetes bacterium]|nr:hypothetical protein [Planctomycetota bacterium]